LDQLENSQFLDDSTRLVVTLINAYNPHLQLFTTVLLRSEFLTTGAVEVSVREVCMIHVGGTRCVTSRTANNMKIRARITLTVECIRTCIFLFLFYV
jgi:hypothetical protein